ncbi:MAG TPA: hypothetical protein VJB94_02905 [Candidatus Nanoarchaeia archaeon]|nr:hypothetical protein [Candidatus Nanoarchaeia archaeon]
MKILKILIAILVLALTVSAVSAQSTRSFGRTGQISFGSGSFASNAYSNDNYGLDFSGNAFSRDFARTSSSSDLRELNDILAQLNSGSSSASNSYSQGYNLNVGDCSLAKGEKMKNKYTYFDKTIIQRNTHGGGPDTKYTILRTGCDGIRGNTYQNIGLSNSASNNYLNGRLLTDSRTSSNSNSLTESVKNRDFDINFNEMNQKTIQNSFGSSGRGNLIILNRAFNQY